MLTEIFYVKNKAWEHPQKVRECITAHLSKLPDGPVEVIIKKFSTRRTSPQNRYYWKLLEYLAPELGYESKDSCHLLVMEQCGFGHYVPFRGRDYFERKSSAHLDVESFGKLIDKCFEIAAFLNESREPEAHIILPRLE